MFLQILLSSPAFFKTMLTKLRSLIITSAVIITALIICGIKIFNIGQEKQKNICEKEKQTILINNINETDKIRQKNSKKTDLQRRKDLKGYVIK